MSSGCSCFPHWPRELEARRAGDRDTAAAGCASDRRTADPWFATRRGTLVSILLKLALCWALIGWTGGISTSYWVILLLPVLSASTTLNLAGALGVTALACVAYLSFTLFVDWGRYEFTQQAFAELGLRMVFLPSWRF